MSVRRTVKVVEIETDYCSRTFGVSPCMATLSNAVPNKCFNTFGTCAYTQAYNKTTNVQKFIQASFPTKGQNFMPALESVSDGYEQEVNIAGYIGRVGALGQRANISVVLNDFPSRDTLTDKYWQDRMSGTGQFNGVGYDPIDRGSYWRKWKARNPNYAGRPIRIIDATINPGGTVTYNLIRHYVMDEIIGPDSNGRVTIKAKDALSLADDKKAMAPVGRNGKLSVEIDEVQTSATLVPEGIGAEYPTSGYATIGSEVVRYTRVLDVLTLERGQRGTTASKHNVDDSVQPAYDVWRTRADLVMRDLFVNYGNIPASYIDTVQWKSEFDKWGNSLSLSATICKPTSVAQLIGEICQLGITVWWDEIAQKIRVKLNHPPEEEPVEWSDRSSIIEVSTEDNDNERATRVEVWTKQIDPTKELGKENFERGWIKVGVAEESPNMFGLPRTHTIYNRWLNHGADSVVKIIAGRLLNRYRRAPVSYNVTVDMKDDVELTDVIALNTYIMTDETGAITPKLTQVYYRKDDPSGTRVKVKLQGFQFDQRYGKITENSRPTYTLSSAAQRDKGTYIVGPSLVFADGTGPYQLI